jgi:hypothetical protein
VPDRWAPLPENPAGNWGSRRHVLCSATAFVSTWVPKRIGHRGAGIDVSLNFGVAIVYNVIGLPYTLCFKVVILCCFPVACISEVVDGFRPVSLTAGVD